MLEKLGWDEMRIFSAELSADKTKLVLEEGCDMFFTAELSKDEAQELIDDLQKLVDQMLSI